MKADYLGKVIEYFDPMQSLDAERAGWYVERPDSVEQEIKIHLFYTRTDSKILFSGHRGSGKTSARVRLASDPGIQEKFFVVKFSVKDELNVADLTYTDLLLAIGHRLFEEGEQKHWLGAKLKADLDKWSAEVSKVVSTTDQAGAEVQAGIKAFFARATGFLKTAFEEKSEFRLKIEPRVPQLIEIIDRIIRAIETHPDSGARELLIIIDDLDKPTVDVVIDLFSTKGPILAQPQCKIIFTVPTALFYSGQCNVLQESFSQRFFLPNFKIKEKSGEHCDLAWKKMREIVERRMDAQLIEASALDKAVEMSGGVVRELVRIVQGAASGALVAKAQCIKLAHVDQAVEKLRSSDSFSLTRQEYIDILKEVQKTKKLLYNDEKPLLDLVNNLFILQYPDGPGWYEVNPIVHKLIGV
jgi:hypothetical protein